MKQFLAILVLALPLAANAIPVLDQENFAQPSESGSLSNGTISGTAQTFTVGIAGLFDSLDVQIFDGDATQARILATAGGAPIGGSGGSTVVATSSSVSNIGNVFTFDFSAAGLAVNVGDIFAIELFGSGGWGGSLVFDNGPYARGSRYFFVAPSGINDWTVSEPFDYNFRTYVDATAVPEPGTFALLGIGLAGLGFARRRQQA